MSFPVTYKNLGHLKPRNNILIYKHGCMCRRVGFDRLGLRPLGEVLGGDHNISHSFLGMGVDFSDIINPPLLKRYKR